MNPNQNGCTETDSVAANSGCNDNNAVPSYADRIRFAVAELEGQVERQKRNINSLYNELVELRTENSLLRNMIKIKLGS